ncbi:MAG: glutaminase A [Bacteroidota bacterium]|nr:glutaminase A [Bacteroidota bacterium]MDX5446778.1 glutaminase A [Bacteroidota bacterium]
MKNTFSGLALLFVLGLGLIAAPLQAQKKGKKPSKPDYQAVIQDAYTKYKDVKEGKNADYIEELAKVDPNIFGIAIVTPDGKVFTVGNADVEVAIESVSKVFTMANNIERLGPDVVMEKIGVDATGLPFNSVMAVEINQGKEINPLVNPGAIMSVSMMAGADSAEQWANIKKTLNAFAGRKLSINMPVYISEANDNRHNEALAVLLQSYGRMYSDPSEANDVYTKQCSMNVNAKDLATMAGTLANGGINPVTGEMVVSPETVAHVLAVMATAGLYDDSGIWLFRTGLPAKSGVGGGLIAVVPGQFGIAVVSPPLDKAGNSVKGQLVIQYVVEALKVNPYLVQPVKKN